MHGCEITYVGICENDKDEDNVTMKEKKKRCIDAQQQQQLSDRLTLCCAARLTCPRLVLMSLALENGIQNRNNKISSDEYCTRIYLMFKFIFSLSLSLSHFHWIY